MPPLEGWVVKLQPLTEMGSSAMSEPALPGESMAVDPSGTGSGEATSVGNHTDLLTGVARINSDLVGRSSSEPQLAESGAVAIVSSIASHEPEQTIQLDGKEDWLQPSGVVDLAQMLSEVIASTSAPLPLQRADISFECDLDLSDSEIRNRATEQAGSTKEAGDTEKAG